MTTVKGRKTMEALFDIGVNLTNRQFASDLDLVIQRGIDAGVKRMLVTGTDLTASRNAMELAQAWPGTLWSTAGIHPHDASQFDSKSVEALRELCRSDVVVAVGECGLDYNRDYSPRDAQARCFDAQLSLAAELKMPVFMHQRDAHADFMNILSPHLSHLPGGVVHCFTGSSSEMQVYLEHGLYLGITGWICDERRGADLRALVREIPLERLLVETDAPYLIPRDLRPKPKSRRNEPRHLPHIVSVIAECIGIPAKEVAAHSTRNALEFFQLS